MMNRRQFMAAGAAVAVVTVLPLGAPRPEPDLIVHERTAPPGITECRFWEAPGRTTYTYYYVRADGRGWLLTPYGNVVQQWMI